MMRAIKRFRVARKMSQADLAFKAGLSQNYVSQLEKGHKSPTINTVYNLCQALEIPMGMIGVLAITEDDIKPEKRAGFKVIKPAIDAMIIEFFLP